MRFAWTATGVVACIASTITSVTANGEVSEDFPPRDVCHELFECFLPPADSAPRFAAGQSLTGIPASRMRSFASRTVW